MNRLCCHVCRIEFSSNQEMVRHFRSKKHKDRAHFGNVDSMLINFVKRFREQTDESN